jgi:uncharacterized glyoxalase superfamily protein PhnB
MPTQSLYPTLRYRDARAAIDFLVNAFGFEEANVHTGEDGEIGHAELRFGPNLLMLGSAREGSTWPQRPSGYALYVVVADPDAHHDRAKAAGAEIVMALTDQDYGSREYGARDPEGNLWSFGTYDPSATGGRAGRFAAVGASMRSFASR